MTSFKEPPQDVEYEDDWLPQDFKPMKFRTLLYKKLTSSPLVLLGKFLDQVLGSAARLLYPVSEG